jgi:hypothetical protein
MTLDHHMFLSSQIAAQLAAAGYPLSDGPTPTSEEQDMWSVIAAFANIRLAIDDDYSDIIDGLQAEGRW